MVETGMVVRVRDDSQPERLSVRSLRAKIMKSLEFMTLWRLYLYETLLGRLPHHYYLLCSLRSAVRRV